MRMRPISFLVLFVSMIQCSMAAQNGCAAPVLSASKGFNMFTEEQDVMLGEVFVESVSLNYRVIEDPALVSYLQRVGDRIAQRLPASQLKFRLFIIDAPYANAFAFPGGRIYLTRKIITNFKSEDEMAGVLAHEMGHQVAHHGALDWSKRFRDISKVEKVKTRADIEDAYHKFLDTYRKNPGLLAESGREDKEQLQADEVAVYASAHAGYRPGAVVEFWDRFTETKGKKGSWFSDVFGTTLPESKRLREFVNNVSKLPATCFDKTSTNANDFQSWQTEVRTYSGFGKKMAVQNLAAKRDFAPQLRSDIQFFRFSPDGKYLIAQDDASIFVINKDPLKTLFRIDAEDAYPAQFTPDSKGIVFYTTGLRVERWSIPEQKMQEVEDLHVFRSCRQTELSPDGKLLACLEPDREHFFPMELALIDVAKGETVFSKKEFIGPARSDWNAYYTYYRLAGWKGDIVNLQFSPDGRYLLAGSRYANLGLDIATKTQISLPGSIKKAMTTNFAFLGPNRMFAVEGDKGEKSVILKFPEGDVIKSDIDIGPRGVTSPGNGDYLIVRPLLKAPVGIFDIKQNKITMGSRTDAIDIFDGVFVGERLNGEIGLYAEPGKPPIATVTLPPAPLARLRASGISQDESLLAVSDRKRGAVWNLKTGERVLFVRGFRGVDFDGKTVALDFPAADDYDSPGTAKQKAKEVEKERREKPGHSIARFDLATGNVAEGDKFQQKHWIALAGKYVIVLNSGKEEENDFSKNASVQVKDIRTGAEVWSRKFDKAAPSTYYDPHSELLLFAWDLESGAAKEELNGDAEAKQKTNAILQPEQSLLVEIVDLTNGKVRSRFPIDTGKGSIRLVYARVMNDRVYITDVNERVIVYTDKGDLVGRYFGKLEAVSHDNKLILLQTERGRLALYDNVNHNKLDVMTFESPIGFAEFSADSKHVLVLTRDQKLYTVTVPQTTAQAN